MYIRFKYEGCLKVLSLFIIFFIFDGFLNRMIGRVLCGIIFFMYKEDDFLYVEFGKE